MKRPLGISGQIRAVLGHVWVCFLGLRSRTLYLGRIRACCNKHVLDRRNAYTRGIWQGFSSLCGMGFLKVRASSKSVVEGYSPQHHGDSSCDLAVSVNCGSFRGFPYNESATTWGLKYQRPPDVWKAIFGVYSKIVGDLSYHRQAPFKQSAPTHPQASRTT